MTCTKKLMNRRQLRSTESVQLTHSELTQTSFRERLHVNQRAETGQTCMQEPHLLKGLKEMLSTAANHWRTFHIMHIEVSRACSHAKAWRIKDRTMQEQMSCCCCERESMAAHETPQAIGNAIGSIISISGKTNWDNARKTCSITSTNGFRVDAW